MLYNSVQQIIRDENSVFQMAALTFIGDRSDQQDSLGYIFRENEGLVVVSDGMGGHYGGRAASQTAARVFLERYLKSGFSTNPAYSMIDAAKSADIIISGLEDEEGVPMGAGSTLVAILIDQERLMWCSVGDSRAYLIRGDEMVQLTQDHNYHTVLIEKLRAGSLTEQEFEKEDVRGEALISFLGIGDLALIDYSESPLALESGDKIVIMTDGLYKLVPDDEIACIVGNFSNIDDAVQALEMKAKKNAKKTDISRDNTTIALIKVK